MKFSRSRRGALRGPRSDPISGISGQWGLTKQSWGTRKGPRKAIQSVGFCALRRPYSGPAAATNQIARGPKSAPRSKPIRYSLGLPWLAGPGAARGGPTAAPRRTPKIVRAGLELRLRQAGVLSSGLPWLAGPGAPKKSSGLPWSFCSGAGVWGRPPELQL